MGYAEWLVVLIAALFLIMWHVCPYLARIGKEKTALAAFLAGMVVIFTLLIVVLYVATIGKP